MNVEIEMALYVCKACGIPFAIPKTFASSRSPGDILCPNGHALYNGACVLERLRVQARALDQDAADYAVEAEKLRRQVSALKGVITKLKRRNS